MKKSWFFTLLLIGYAAAAQNDSTKLFRAFPVTDYMLDINDSTKVVQLEMPEGIILKEKQLGVMYGVYATSSDDAVEKGYGRCNLIKGQYYYFTISNNKSGVPLKQGDLLYTQMDKPSIFLGRIPRLAAHFIRLLNVTEEPLYDRYLIFNGWTTGDEKKLTDSLVADIRYTGDYFLSNAPGMNQSINTGKYKERKVLEVMKDCTAPDVQDFLDYMLARPRLYAGRDWKISEIFATWLVNGAPAVKK